ncbi:MAG: serine/threonine protein phosphatase [Magnetospirillum sp.]|nr:serine/threonine protein phosphatase [Magnetospirillum sp.]
MKTAGADPASFPVAGVPAGTRVYAVGDVHGRTDLLDLLLARMAEEVAVDRPERLVVVFLGDYVDRGPDSRGVVERLAAGPPSGPLAGAEWVCLRGNHEDFLLRFLDGGADGKAWCYNGGLETVRSYAGAIPDGLEGDMAALQLLLSRALPPAHLRFLSRLKLSWSEGDYVFVHAGVRPGVALEDQAPADLMWIRDDFLAHGGPMDKVVVHGHSVRPTPEVRPWRIGIDTGAYRTGLLTALVLEGGERRFLVG